MPPKLECPSLFARIYDLPWQCALLRGLDFVHPMSWLRPLSEVEWLWQMHNHAALGRELHQLALDFYAHDVESPWKRLSDAIRVLKHVLETGAHDGEDVINDERRERLNTWLGEQIVDEAALVKVRDHDVLPLLTKKRNGISLAKQHDARTLLALGQLIDTWPASRRLQRVLGLKLEELLCILRDGGHIPQRWRPLTSLLSVKSKAENRRAFGGLMVEPRVTGTPYHDDLLCALSREPNARPVQDRETRIPLLACMFTRVCTAGSYEVDPNRMSLKDSILPPNGDNGYWWDVKRPIRAGATEPPVEWFYTLLGRYDVLSVMEIRPMARSELPRFRCGRDDHSTTIRPSQETFPAFFVRREMVVPVRLGERGWELGPHQARVVAVITVTLSRVAARLSFLTRLREVSKEDYIRGRKSRPGNLNGLGGFFSSGDFAFLSDGWSDVHLVLVAEQGRSLEEIFTIQGVLYDDFQVEHTELILTPQWVAEACRCVHEDFNQHQFRVWVNARLMASRTLARHNEDFLDELRRQGAGLRGYTLARIPGVMDYQLQIEPTQAREQADSLYRNIVEAVVQNRTDRFRTVIGFVEDKKAPGL